jgi:hypothetical protein
MNDPGSVMFLKDLFSNLNVKEVLAEHFIVFGVDHGTTEANFLSNEFAITSAPYVAAILPTGYSEYNTIEEFKDQLKSDAFFRFLERSCSTAALILEAKHEMETSTDRRPRSNSDALREET